IELFAPDQSCLLALVDNGLKEATEQLDAIALTNTRETRMVGQRLIQIVADVPAHAEPISSKLHQESFRANVVEEHHQLQLEEDHRIYGGATCTSIRLFDQVAHKREIYHIIQMAIEMIGWNKLIKRHHSNRRKDARFGSHHGSFSPCQHMI